MAILNILEYPDPRLRTRAKPIETVDARIRKLADDMLETTNVSSSSISRRLATTRMC